MITRFTERTSSDDTCGTYHVDGDKVWRIRGLFEREGSFDAAVRMFQLLADPTRVRLLFALAHEELCVCDLAAIVGRSRPAVSHQLRLLKDLKLVKYRRQGKMAYYTLADDHVTHLVQEGLEHAGGF